MQVIQGMGLDLEVNRQRFPLFQVLHKDSAHLSCCLSPLSSISTLLRMIAAAPAHLRCKLPFALILLVQ